LLSDLYGLTREKKGKKGEKHRPHCTEKKGGTIIIQGEQKEEEKKPLSAVAAGPRVGGEGGEKFLLEGKREGERRES